MPATVNIVNWFEIPVTDLTRARKFYEAAFSIEIAEVEMGPNKMGWFPMEMGAAGATGSLVQGDGYAPSYDGTIVYMSVAAIDPTLAAISKAGGKMLVPRTSIGEHGFFAHFADTEGNRVALHEPTAS